MAVADLMRLHVISVTQARQRMISSWIDERVLDVATIVQQPMLVEQVERLQQGPNPAARADLERALESVQLLETAFEGLALFDLNWEIIASSSPGTHENDQIATPSFRQGVQAAQDVYIGAPHLHEGREVGSHIGSVVRDREGDSVAFLVANLNLTRSLAPILQDRSGLWTTGKAFLIDEAGRIITEPRASEGEIAFNTFAVPAQLELKDSSGQEVRIYLDFLSNEVIGAATKLATHDWLLAVEINTEEAMKWVDTLLLRVTLMVGVALLAVLVTSAWMSAQLGRPLARLAAVAHRISAGHTDERVGPLHIVEAEEVRRAVNRMLDELREKEEALIRSATLATVGELTSSVVHEMRNPLSSIKMNLQSLMNAGTGDDQNHELAQIAYDQTRRLESMLNELLRYGRPLALTWEYIPLSDLVETAVSLVESKSIANHVEVSTNLEDAAKPVHVDVEQFHRALSNLIQNAIEASPPGGRVDVNVCTSIKFDGGTCFMVCDRGHGVQANHFEKLFKPFFTTKSDGIGLGLANVKKIISLHGGTVEAANLEGGGTSFQIDIP